MKRYIPRHFTDDMKNSSLYVRVEIIYIYIYIFRFHYLKWRTEFFKKLQNVSLMISNYISDSSWNPGLQLHLVPNNGSRSINLPNHIFQRSSVTISRIFSSTRVTFRKKKEDSYQCNDIRYNQGIIIKFQYRSFDLLVIIIPMTNTQKIKLKI